MFTSLESAMVGGCVSQWWGLAFGVIPRGDNGESPHIALVMYDNWRGARVLGRGHGGGGVGVGHRIPSCSTPLGSFIQWLNE